MVGLALTILIGSALSTGLIPPALAQSGTESWTQPLNLSRSGAASNPQMTITPDGIFHVIWADQFDGVVYSSGNGLDWTPPQAVVLPFATEEETYVPALLATSSGLIHAFWIDNEGSLLHSQVKSENFVDLAAWSATRRLAESAAVLSEDTDAEGNVHLVYVQSEDLPLAPAGVYYIRSNGDGGWSEAVSLYQSSYFRSLAPENARVHISTPQAGNGDQVYAAWDNPARERVFFTRSLDGGTTWDTPTEVDQPVDGTLTGGPANILVEAQGSNVMLLWQTASTGVSCTQYYQWSGDNASTWNERQRMFENVSGCPSNNKLLALGDGRMALMTSLNKQVYLAAWDGSQWSRPQLQTALNGFMDQDTFRPVQFGCLRPALIGDNQLYVVGCDEGNGGDIWMTMRPLDGIAGWFAQDGLWSSPAMISAGQSPIYQPIIVTDEANIIHAFWSQPAQTTRTGPGGVIFYARLEGNIWSAPQPLLASPDGLADQPSVAIRDGRLFTVWRSGQSGQLFFSDAEAARALVSSAWSVPLPLPIGQRAGSSPEIVAGQQDALYVAYSVPLNEGRGIYLTRSRDGGVSWEEPITVFDAGAAGWAMVDNPHLALTGTGQLHMIWTRHSLPNGSGPLALFYVRSDDGGQTWSQPETVVESPVVWSRIFGFENQIVHRVWEEMSGGRSNLWHEVSSDSGSTWKRIAPVSIFGDTVGQPTFAMDRAGRLHLVQAVSRGTIGVDNRSYLLQHWIYDGENWVAEQSLDLGNMVSSELENLNSIVTQDGRLGVIFSGLSQDASTGSTQRGLVFTSRVLDVPAAPVVEPVPVVQNPAPVAQPTSTPEPEPTATPTQNAAAEAGIDASLLTRSGNGDSSWTAAMVGLGASGLIVLIVLVLGVRGSLARRRW